MKKNSTVGTFLIILISYIIGYLFTFSFVFLTYWIFGAIVSNFLVIICLIISIFLAIPIGILLLGIVAMVFVD